MSQVSRKEAKELLYKLINSGVLSEDIEEALTELANAICENSLANCTADIECSYGAPNYCDDCEFLEE